MFGIKPGFWSRLGKKLKKVLPAIITFVAGIVKSETEKAKEEPKDAPANG